MMTFKMKLFLIVVFFSVSATTGIIYAACCGQRQFRRTKKCPDDLCRWGRGSKRCSNGQQCCSGWECTSFGRCQRCVADIK